MSPQIWESLHITLKDYYNWVSQAKFSAQNDITCVCLSACGNVWRRQATLSEAHMQAVAAGHHMRVHLT